MKLIIWAVLGALIATDACAQVEITVSSIDA